MHLVCTLLIVFKKSHASKRLLLWENGTIGIVLVKRLVAQRAVIGFQKQYGVQIHYRAKKSVQQERNTAESPQKCLLCKEKRQENGTGSEKLRR